MELKDREGLKAMLTVGPADAAIIIKADGSWEMIEDAIYMVKVIDASYSIYCNEHKDSLSKTEAVEAEVQHIEQAANDELVSNG